MFNFFRSYMNKPAQSALYKNGLWLVALLTFALNFIVLAIPIYILQVYDRVLLARSLDTLLLLSMGVGFVVVFNSFVEKTRGEILVRVANRFELQLLKKLFDSGMHDAAYFNRVSIQSMSDIRQIKQFITSENGFAILLEAPWSAMYVIILFFAHPLFGFTSLGFIVVLLTITLIEDSFTAKYITSSQDSALESNQKMNEFMMGAQTIEAMGMREEARKVWERLALKSASDGSKANEVLDTMRTIMKFSRLVQTIVMTATGAYLAMDAQISVGAMIVAGLLAAKGTAPLEMFISGLKHFKLTLQAFDGLNEKFKNVQTQEDQLVLPSPKGDISFERVVYAPPKSETTVLKGVSFKIEAGTFLGIIGPSGSGKSTIAKLAAGLYAPYSGSIRVDGADIAMYERQRFGKNLGYLPQEVVLFEGSIKDNISRFSSGSDEEILKAAMLAGAHEMILKLPKGYETQVGSRGMNLSGGQRQRIGLARALFGSPKIIILDEPNSALDSEAEARLIETLALLKTQKITIIVITHKPAILSNADKLLVVANGVVEKFGTHAQIVGNYKLEGAK